MNAVDIYFDIGSWIVFENSQQKDAICYHEFIQEVNLHKVGFRLLSIDSLGND